MGVKQYKQKNYMKKFKQCLFKYAFFFQCNNVLFV